GGLAIDPSRRHMGRAGQGTGCLAPRPDARRANGARMLLRLKAFLQDLAAEPQRQAPRGPAELRLAAAALLAEAARVDGRIEPEERRTIVRPLRERFGLDEDEAAELAALAEQTAAQSVQYFGFVDVINRRLSPDERVGLIEMLWEVVYAD